ncbi:Fe-S cluster protein [Caldimicrobium thiodismutans]|uniref:Fe-S cluster protein n=1 Tax=Caldimicrobium thiodismutans TaxID=1653476 RepID=A0A0U5AIC1_9BACT|nr:DUF3786 domain-containing protein [Caldimicrobium thiodismutans]BAU23639.1 Fe-S cluster protein [Caldimicrobium thiodismutans]
MKSYLDLLKLLPKTNCKECGFESCLLFALKVFSKEAAPEKCPYLPLESLPQELLSSKLSFNQLLENLKYLKERFRALNLIEIGENLGALFEKEPFSLRLFYLDTEITLPLDTHGHPLELKDLRGKDLDPRDEILLCNYFLFNGKAPLTGNFVNLSAFPHSISKVKTLKLYAEDPLREIFSEAKSHIRELLKNFRISEFKEREGGFSVIIWALPRIPLQVNYWEGDPEEGLPPSCKVLYDSSAITYLDLECLVFLAERLAEKLRDYA